MTDRKRHGLLIDLGDRLPDFRLNVVHLGAGSFGREIPPFAHFPIEYGKIYRFDADTEVRTRSSDEHPNIVTLPYAVADCDGERTLYICENTGASGFYKSDFNLIGRWHYGDKQVAALHRIVEERVVKTRSLDSLLADGTIGEIDFLRMNIQGGELLAVNGGKNALSRSVGIQTELSFEQTYVGAPLFANIDPILRSAGYAFFNFVSSNHVTHSNRLMLNYQNMGYSFPACQNFESHCLYLKDFARVRGHVDIEKLLKACVVAEMYGQITFAYDMLLLAQSLIDATRATLPESKALADAVQAATTSFVGRWTIEASEMQRREDDRMERDNRINTLTLRIAELEDAHTTIVAQMEDIDRLKGAEIERLTQKVNDLFIEKLKRKMGEDSSAS
jgi:FkbM family methyltransferase